MSPKKTIPNAIFFASVEVIIAEGRSVEMVVRGVSMRPFLRDGKDVVVLSPLPAEGVSVGMVVLFRHRGSHVLHRLVAIGPEGLIFEGDGNYRLRECATADSVVAYVSEVRKSGGRVLAYKSLAWRVWSAVCLCRKCLRRVAIDVKRTIKR